MNAHANHLRSFIHHQRLAAYHLSKYTGKRDDELMDRLTKARKALENRKMELCLELLGI